MSEIKSSYFGFNIQKEDELHNVLGTNTKYEDITLDTIHGGELRYYNKKNLSSCCLQFINKETVRSDYMYVYTLFKFFETVKEAEKFHKQISTEINHPKYPAGSCISKRGGLGSPRPLVQFYVHEKSPLYKKLFLKKRLLTNIDILLETKISYFNIIPKDITNTIKQY